MPLIHTEIEINRPPEEVRRVFLDFPAYPSWGTGFGIVSAKGTGDKVVAGDKLDVNAGGMKFKPKVLENTPQEFRWLGSLPFIFSGEHKFRFEPSKTTPGSTHFVQSEHFTGLLSFLVGGGTSGQFEKFNENLKKRVEGGR